MSRSISSRAVIGAALSTFVICGALGAGTVQVSYDGPTLDRWFYAFNQMPGTRIAGSTFGAFTPDGSFDNRDGQLVIGFETSGDVTPGLGAASYVITSATLLLQNDNDFVFIYDDTPDPYNAFLDPADPAYVADEDPGQALELFGVGFRNGVTSSVFDEFTPYCPGCDPVAKSVRSAYALGYDATDQPVDVSNSVDERWDPAPFAVGIIDTVTPGDFVPADTVMTFDLDVASANVHGYLAVALDAGRLDLAVTSHTLVEPMGGAFPSFYLRENPLVLDGIVSAAQLTLTVEIIEPAFCTSDITGPGGAGAPDGNVDALDFLLLIAQWGSPCAGSCEADLTGPADVPDGNVDALDFLRLIAEWGSPGNCPQP
jgi:hypothetical protein